MIIFVLIIFVSDKVQNRKPQYVDKIAMVKTDEIDMFNKNQWFIVPDLDVPFYFSESHKLSLTLLNLVGE